MADGLGSRTIRRDVLMQVIAREKEIHLLFSVENDKHELVATETGNMLLSPENALQFAALIADMAYEADGEMKPAGGAIKAALIERARVKMNLRVTHMLKTARHDKKLSNERLAQSIVDYTLREIYEP